VKNLLKLCQSRTTHRWVGIVLAGVILAITLMFCVPLVQSSYPGESFDSILYVERSGVGQSLFSVEMSGVGTSLFYVRRILRQVLWYQPIAMVVNTAVKSGVADVGSTDIKIIDAALDQVDDYWNYAKLTIVETTDNLAPEGEIAVVTDFLAATDELQFAALTASVDAGDIFDVEFGTLIDRAGSNNAKITWGDNPSGISVVVGGLEPSDVIAPIVSEEPVTPDYVSETPAIDSYAESEGANIPLLYPLFEMAASTTGIPIQVFWMSGAMIIAMIVGVLVMMYLKTMLGAAFASGTTLVVFCNISIIPWWVLYVYAFMAICFVVYQKVSHA